MALEDRVRSLEDQFRRMEVDRIHRDGKRDLVLIVCLGVLALVVLALIPAPR